MFVSGQQQHVRKEKASGRNHVRSRLRKVSSYSEQWQKVDHRYLSNAAPHLTWSYRKLVTPTCGMTTYDVVLHCLTSW